MTLLGKRTVTRLTTIVLFAATTLAVPPIIGAQDTNELFELEISLPGAIQHGGKPQSPRSQGLTLILSREKGEWWPVNAQAYNQGGHQGYLSDVVVSETNMTFDVMVKLGADPWIAGGFGQYQVSLERKANGTLVGTYKGTFAYDGTGEDLPFAGAASGFVLPPRPIRVPDFKPLESGEHPRLAFRRRDSDKIRAKATNTRFGRDVVAAFEKLPADKNTVVQKAFLYWLTKDKKYVEQALPHVEWHMGQYSAGAHAVEEWRHRVPRIALAADLMWDGLPPDFKQRFAEYADMMTMCVWNKLTIFGSGFNFNPCSNWYAPVVGGGNVIGYMLLGEPGREPPEPVPPLGTKTNTVVDSDALSKTMAKFSNPKAVKQAMREYEWKMREWHAAHHFWKLHGTRPDNMFTFHNASFQNYKHLRVGMGDGGFQSEPNYAQYSHPNPLLAAAIHRSILGRDQSGYPDATHFIPRHMMTMLFPENGKPYTIDIHGGSGVENMHIGITFPIAPDELKPALLWAWNKVAGIDPNDESTYVRAVTAGGFFSDVHNIIAFVNYPLDMKPVNPREIYPKTWAATTRGMYIFRNAWEGKNDFVCQLYTYNSPIGGKVGPVGGGTFNIWGQGQFWTGDKTPGSHTLSGWGFQYCAPVIYIPDAGRAVRGFGHVKYYDPKTDGSAIVTIDLNDHYGLGKLVPAPPDEDVAPEDPGGRAHLMTARELRDRVIKVTRPPTRMSTMSPWSPTAPPNRDALDPDGGKGFRSIAFDYSAKAGAPLLVAVVDHVDMKETKEWHFTPMVDVPDRFPADAGLAIMKESLKIEGNSFTVNYTNRQQSLKATFLSPPNVSIELWTTNFNLGRDPQQVDMVTTTVVRAMGPTGKEGDFFVVYTIQPRDPPKVATEGQGLSATAVIGSRQIRFDGANVVLE